MKGFLLDTNVVSALRTPHRQPECFQRWLSTTDVATCYVSTFTLMELKVGVLKKSQTDPLQGRLLLDWFQSMLTQFRHHTLSFDVDAATVTAPLWLLRPRGTIDTLIAGTALVHQIPLVTRNTSDFVDLSLLNGYQSLGIGLRVEVWAAVGGEVFSGGETHWGQG